MAATQGYKGAIYSIDNSVTFSTAFSGEATTESGVTKQYQIDDSAKQIWDANVAVSVAGYWAFQEFGLSVASGDSSGLGTTTQYYFKLAIDGGSVVEYDFTTGATVTWADIVALIDTAISAAGATCQFINGDVRIHSDDVTSNSDISLSAGTTGTSLFGAGNVPAVAALETVDYTDIYIDAGYGAQGINYVQGIVHMSHTGFTSLTVAGSYHDIVEIAQLTDYSLSVNWATADITDFGNTAKLNTATTKNGTFSCNGFFATEYWIDVLDGQTIFIKLFITESGNAGYLFSVICNHTVNASPGDVVRESISGDITGNIYSF